MTTPKHTPTPWKVRKQHAYETDRGFVIDSMADFSEVDLPGEVIGVASAEKEANAAFIVRAVNAHDDLVTSLTWARDALAFIADDIKNGRQVNITNFSDILTESEQVIAKARG